MPFARPATTPPSLSQIVDGQLAAVERELAGLRDEVQLLRHRDHTLNSRVHLLDEELRLAARLQQEFLPRHLPTVGGTRFHALWRPAGYVSGDLYDVVRLDEQHVGFYIADAVGHGVPAALLTMFVRHAMVTKVIEGASYRLLDPGETLTRLNEALLGQELSAGTFCTAFYAVLNTATLEMRYACAGHPPPFLFRGDEPAFPVKAEGPLLGIFEGERYPTVSCQLERGDRIVIFTDGIEVAFAEDRQPNSERWKQELQNRRSLPGDALLRDLESSWNSEAGSLDPRDDLTLLVADVG